ncbi:MAG: peptide-methionine (R)-S-oxide reductase MsrB [Candidatus Anstonellales archaeon]
MDEQKLKKKLTPEEYRVLREKATETPFSGKLLYEKRSGTYHCKVCDTALFSSEAKFDSGNGWPSFDKALPGSVKEVPDKSLGTLRTEIICAKCNSHLGHVFDDGPTDTGKRYCINSVCLNLVADKRKVV